MLLTIPPECEFEFWSNNHYHFDKFKLSMCTFCEGPNNCANLDREGTLQHIISSSSQIASADVVIRFETLIPGLSGNGRTSRLDQE